MGKAAITETDDPFTSALTWLGTLKDDRLSTLYCGVSVITQADGLTLLKQVAALSDRYTPKDKSTLINHLIEIAAFELAEPRIPQEALKVAVDLATGDEKEKIKPAELSEMTQEQANKLSVLSSQDGIAGDLAVKLFNLYGNANKTNQIDPLVSAYDVGSEPQRVIAARYATLPLFTPKP